MADFVEQAQLQVEQLLQVFQLLTLGVQFLDVVAQLVDLVEGLVDQGQVDLLCPVERGGAFLILLELYQLLAEEFRALHDLVTLALLNDNDVLLDLADLLVELAPNLLCEFNVGLHVVQGGLIHLLLLELLQDLVDAVLHGALLAADQLVHLVEVADALEHGLEQGLVPVLGLDLDAFLDAFGELPDVLEQVRGIGEEEAALLVVLVLDDLVQVG